MAKFILVQEPLVFQGSSIRTGSNSTELTRPAVYSSQDNGHISVDQTRFDNDLTYDPLRVYTSWYGRPDSQLYTVQVQSWLIDNCLWSKTEISDWVEVFCNEVCFATRIYGDDWSLHFLDLDDMTKFQEWMRIKSSNSFPFIRCESGVDVNVFKKEVDEWCIENFKGKYRLRLHASNPPVVRISCQSEDDLMLVKLRWADHQIT